MQRFFHQALEHVQLSFHVMQSNGYFFFLICFKKTATKQVNEDEEKQLKAYKQLFSVLINLDPPVEIDRL